METIEKLTKEGIRSIPPYIPGNTSESVKEKYHLDHVLKLASNENQYGCSPKALEAMGKTVAEANIYPDPFCMGLRRKLSRKYGFDDSGDNVIISAGASGILLQMCIRDRLCGAGESSALYPIAVSYLKITAFGQFFSIMNLALAAVIRAEGNTRYAMVVTMSGALLNCVLDAVFMLAFHMGVEGAALGTVIGQIVSCLMSLQYYVRGLGAARFLGVRSFRPSTAARVASLGLAPSVFQALSFVNNILVNQSLRCYADLELGAGGGDMALSAVSVMQTVENLAIMFIMGMNNAVSTVISYNYGSGQYERVRKATLTGQMVASVVSILLWAATVSYTHLGYVV